MKETTPQTVSSGLEPSKLVLRTVRGVQNRLHRYLFDAAYDRYRKVETGGIHHPKELFAEAPEGQHAVEYTPTPSWMLTRLFSRLPGDLSRFSFVDLGCGKGRVLLAAAKMPFAKVEGVELASSLARTAERNLSALPSQLSSKVTVHQTDARQYEFPKEPLVVFAYNPFDAHILQTVLDNLDRSLADEPREAFFIYVNSEHSRLLAARSSFELVQIPLLSRLLDLTIWAYPIRIYRNKQTCPRGSE